MADLLTEVHPRDALRAQPRDLARLELAAPFAGWWVDIDTDVELGALEDLSSQDVTRIVTALSTMIAEWNFVGKDGQPLPCDAAGLRKMGKALLAALLAAFGAYVSVPNS